MTSSSQAPEIDLLGRRLLSDPISHDENEDSDEVVLYRASFQEMEENFVKYQTALWILSSLPLILACGIGLLMLIYLPVRRRIVRRDFRSRKLYVTSNAIVYKVTKPVFVPFFGVLKKEKHVVLPSLKDVVVEQGYLQSLFGIYSIRFENFGVRRPASDDVQIHGVVHPKAFRKAIMMLLSSIRNENFSRQVSVSDDLPTSRAEFSRSPQSSLSRTRVTPRPMSPSRFLLHESVQPSTEQLLHKLGDVGNAVKKIHSLVEKQL